MKKGRAAKEEMRMAMYRTKAEWDEIDAKFKKSGQTIRAFSEAQGINSKTMERHVRLLKKEESEKRGANEWKRLIDEQKCSGQSLALWCREHEINESAMRSALGRQKASDDKLSQWIELAPASAPEEIKEEQKVVLAKQDGSEPKREIIMVAKEEERGKIRIRVSGFEIEADTDYPVERLAKLLGKLVKTC